MLQKESQITRSANSGWLQLKIFHIYNSGHHSCGHPSFIIIGSIRRRRYISPNKRRSQIAHKAFGCLTNSIRHTPWIDGQLVISKANKAAPITQRIRRSRLKIKGLIFLATRRNKYLKHAKSLI